MTKVYKSFLSKDRIVESVYDSGIFPSNSIVVPINLSAIISLNDIAMSLN